MVTVPASRPALSVVMVWAVTGSTAAAKPLPTVVCTKLRRLKSRDGARLSISSFNMGAPGGGELRRGVKFCPDNRPP